MEAVLNQLPDIKIPEINLPDISLPEIPLPPFPALDLPCLSAKICFLDGDEAKKIQRIPIQEQTWLESFLTMVSFLFFFGTFALCLPLVIISIYYTLVYRSPIAIAFLVLMITLAIFPRKIRTWPWFIHQPVWVMWRSYFNQTYIKTTPIPTDRRYVFAEWPHGVFMMGQWLSQSVHGHVFKGTAYTKGAAADITLAFPLMRQFYSWYGCVSASPASLREEVDRGYNLGICPGGIAEMFLSNPTEALYFENRTGYIRLAIEKGMDIIPVYHLGNTQGFVRAPFGDKFFAELSRKTRIAIFWPVGRFYLPIPQKFPIVSLIGSPIRANKTDNEQEEVKRVQNEIKTQLQQLFNDYKHLVGWEDRELFFR